MGTWLPALDGVAAMLDSGSAVAEVGCGRGAATLLMAAAYPRSTFVGYDHHAPSVAWANRAAAQAGLAGRVRFETSPAPCLPEAGFRLVTTFACMHETSAAAGLAAGIRAALTSGGTWLLVEPTVGDQLEDNLTPIGKIYYNASTMISTPSGRCPDAGGLLAGESRLRAVTEHAGFTRFRRIADSGEDIAYEVRP
ncbi:methyltransferase domain-containing protein [Pseudonocardia saturnea]